MRNTFLLLLTLTLFAGRVAGQCTLKITDPNPVCFPSTVNLSDPAITAGSSAGLTYTYWTDALASVPYAAFATATAGTYYIKGDDGAGCTQIGPVVVKVTTPPTATITYAGTPFCISINTPQPVTLSGTGAYTGGSYSSAAGLSINASSGAITPASSTAGTYTVTYTIPASGGCPTVPVNTSVTIVGIPAAPILGTIVQPTCTVSTGSVPLSGLPSFGDWTVTVSPGGTIAYGSGLITTISGLSAGSYTFRVTNYAGCISIPSLSAVIQVQPSIPTAPIVGTVNPPTCTVATGSVVLNGLPATGTWTLRRYPGSITTSGTGTSFTVTGLPTGTYNYSITNEALCVSASLSNDVVIPSQPSSPSAPVIGAITQPVCTLPTGSVELSGLPPGNWLVTIAPGGATYPGTTATTVISGIAAGTYTLTVTGSNTCTSPASSPVVINAAPPIPTAPQIGTITQPTCGISTGSIVLNSLPAGSWVLTRNPGGVTTAGSTTSITVSNLDPGSYTFTVTNGSGCISPVSASTVIDPRPPAPGTPSYTIDCALSQLTVTTPLGADIQYSLNGGSFQSGTVFSSVTNGSYFLTARNLQGCQTSTGIFAVSCGCLNPPVITLSLTSDSTCGTTPLTISGNTFSGSATSVTITENGAGTVTPSSSGVSPFSFTYTPGTADRGRTVLISFTSNNPLGTPCTPGIATFTLFVNPVPSAPTIGTVTNLTCTNNTGSIVLNGLPSIGTWTLTRHPDEIATASEGTTTTVTGLPAGTFTFTVTSAEGCSSAVSASAVVNPQPGSPTAPVIGALTQPDCANSTGSVALSGLPASGTWTLTRLPGGSTRTGSGATYIATTIPGGTYTYSVTNAAGCTSPPSESFVINDQPLTPTPPSIGQVTPPGCTTETGSVVLLGLPTGNWTLTRYSGGIETTGSGTSHTVTGIPSGTYNYTVRNAANCVSTPSANVVIPVKPSTPAPPVIGTITQPTLTIPTGSVVLNGLPSGAWIITRLPDNVTTANSGTSFTITGLAGGLYTFTVTNSFGCISDTSADVTISTPGKPKLVITDPPAACSPGKVDLTAPSITAGSTTGLTFSYWTDINATEQYATPAAADAGTYYIKGATVAGFFDIKPVIAVIDQPPVSNAGPDQALSAETSTTLAAVPGENETGIWSVESGEGVFADVNDPTTEVSNLKQGTNSLLWVVTKGVCPADTDKVLIIVGDLIIPTLITPNGDTKNEYFVIRGLESLETTELVVFDRRGAVVFKNIKYDNKWNGVDYNENPLPNDTYFFRLKSANGRVVSGYIVIRR